MFAAHDGVLQLLKNQRQIVRSPVLRFPRKLWKLANECRTGAISWSPDGTSVLVRYSLFREFLNFSDDFFNTGNISSFVRQLNLYGFRKVYRNAQKAAYKSNPDLHEFSHPLFQRDRPDLLAKVSRRSRDSSKVLTAVSPPTNLKIKLVIKAPSIETSGKDATTGVENIDRCPQELAVPSSANPSFKASSEPKKFCLLDNILFKNLQSLGAVPVNKSTSAQDAPVPPAEVQKISSIFNNLQSLGTVPPDASSSALGALAPPTKVPKKRGRKPGVKIGAYKNRKVEKKVAKKVETSINKPQGSALKDGKKTPPQWPSLIRLDDGDPPTFSNPQDESLATDESSSRTLFDEDDESLFPPNYGSNDLRFPVFNMSFQETLESLALSEIMQRLNELEEESDSD